MSWRNERGPRWGKNRVGRRLGKGYGCERVNVGVKGVAAEVRGNWVGEEVRGKGAWGAEIGGKDVGRRSTEKGGGGVTRR